MLIRNTEPGTFLRLSLFNTRLLLRKNPFSTFRGGGLLVAVAMAYAAGAGFGASIRWFPVFFAGAYGGLLGLDFVTGVRNTMTELKVIDTLGDSYDDSGEACTEEGQPRGEEGETGAGV